MFQNHLGLTKNTDKISVKLLAAREGFEPSMSRLDRDALPLK